MLTQTPQCGIFRTLTRTLLVFQGSTATKTPGTISPIETATLKLGGLPVCQQGFHPINCIDIVPFAN
ncbi:hypothetical protein TWF225_010823 [Orbilia oligospora]|nr:hypothetical protein TWF225_010823 [Orbilia oligospora]